MSGPCGLPLPREHSARCSGVGVGFVTRLLGSHFSSFCPSVLDGGTSLLPSPAGSIETSWAEKTPFGWWLLSRAVMHRKLCKSRVLAAKMCVRLFGIIGRFFLYEDCKQNPSDHVQPGLVHVEISGSCQIPGCCCCGAVWESVPVVGRKAQELLLLVRRYFGFAAPSDLMCVL